MAETSKKPVAKSGKAKKAAMKESRQAKAAKRQATTQPTQAGMQNAWERSED
ncbi:hypothetical protein [Nonomuraea sediminis]|uniref:hypothetical protein n=1 Tax=Nonomuraea sediminis TaxID=2835864 RepID=UPI001BDDC0E5|nr:hypothetical protein [Nonomuraea sediminis]